MTEKELKLLKVANVLQEAGMEKEAAGIRSMLAGAGNIFKGKKAPSKIDEILALLKGLGISGVEKAKGIGADLGGSFGNLGSAAKSNPAAAALAALGIGGAGYGASKLSALQKKAALAKSLGISFEKIATDEDKAIIASLQKEAASEKEDPFEKIAQLMTKEAKETLFWEKVAARVNEKVAQKEQPNEKLAALMTLLS